MGQKSPQLRNMSNEELQAIHNEYQGIDLDPFLSPSNFLGMVIQFAYAVTGQYQTLMFLEYTCEPFVCRSAKTLDYLDPGDSMSASIVVPSNISTINIMEFRFQVGNTQSSQWQSGYHQAIHYDVNWNYLDGDTRTSNFWYPYNQYSDNHTVHASYNADGGDQTYQYLYFDP